MQRMCISRIYFSPHRRNQVLEFCNSVGGQVSDENKYNENENELQKKGKNKSRRRRRNGMRIRSTRRT
jgi:hypothetical protein